MKTILILIAGLSLFAASARAQTVVSVDIRKAKLHWDWTRGTGGTADEFRVKCGNTGGNYSKITILADPAAREIPLQQAITGSGNWFCVVTAANQYGESGPSNEIPFSAGDIPSGPTNLTVQAN